MLPGILGALLGALFAIRLLPVDGGAILLSAGCGAFIAYLVLAVLLYAGSPLGETIFQLVYLRALAGLLALCLFAAMLYVGCRPRLKAGYGFIFSSPILLIVGVNLYQVALAPVASWDSLTFWASYAHDYIWFDEMRSAGETFQGTHARHPLTVVYLAAFAGHAANQGVSHVGTLAPWWFVWVSGAMAVTGAVFAISRRYWLACLAAYAYCSLPLLENHATLVGYADLWVSVNVTIVAALFAVGLSRAGRGYLVLGVLLSFAPLALKNTGVLYSIGLLLPVFIVFLRARFPRLLIFFMIFSAFAGVWFFSQGFELSIAGKRYALAWGEGGQIAFGGYTLPLSLYPLDNVLYNHLWAFFVNQSFTMAVGIGFCSAVWLIAQRGKIKLNVSMPLQFLLGSAVSLTVIFMIPQLATSYAEKFAVPSSDIGMSRFLLGVAPILIITLAFWPQIGHRPSKSAVIERASNRITFTEG